MATRNTPDKKEKLAAALKENIKKRKEQARARGAAKSQPAKNIGVAPQGGLETEPEPRPTSVKKQR
jgi:hypothetical protein